PSTHGVLRLILELEGETVTEARAVVGYLHTGIEKNLEYRNWTQGTTFVTRMDYLAPIFNETAYCLAVEKLLGIEDQITERARTKGIAVLDAAGCLALGITGPVLRAAGLPWDIRRTMPYMGYETYEFDVPTSSDADVWGRYQVRLNEMRQSLRLVEQALERLRPGPVMVADRKIAWPAQLAVGVDGLGNSLEHVAKIMGQSMEALIHHFKLVTEGFRVPAGQVYVPVEAPRGALGAHVVSDGGTRPYRVHYREPSF